MKRLFLWIVVVGFFVGALWVGWSFRSGNVTPIDLDLIWIRIANVEVWWVILVAIAAGAIVATSLVGFLLLRAHWLNIRYRRVIKRLESELHQMRSLPLSGSDIDPGGSSEVISATASEKG